MSEEGVITVPSSTIGALKVDGSSLSATLKGKDLGLRASELIILAKLAENAGSIVVFRELWAAYRPDTEPSMNMLRSVIFRVRKALGDSAKALKGVRNVGFLLSPSELT